MKKICLILFCMVSLQCLAQNEGDNDVVQQMGENELNQLEEANQNTTNVANGINDAIGHLNTALGLYEDAQDLYNSSQALSSGECSPDFSTTPNSMMSSSCKREDECAQCYTRAVGELNFIRRQLGRRGCIYQNTKNFTNSAIAFGDNASGIHAVTGLAWQNARGEIVATMNHFKQTYDNKYRDMIGALERALREIDKCENKYGQEGWFQRSGFIYLEFLKDKYRRND